ncbi:MAG: glycosyltransferase [Lachnospiraceae bacterium]|nr:glycosyltransferase [Candidatus Colinaster equi]
MKVLIVNKFLYPNGGSETYIFKLGEQLEKMGHTVQYFGMEHEGRIVGNDVDAYTSNMDFHGSKLSKITYPFKIIYSFEARRKIRMVLDSMHPDVVHLNNINFQITPSIIYEIRAWQKRNAHNVKIVFTAHDYQWICPNHMMCKPTGEICEACIRGEYVNCVKNNCIHGSKLRSLLGMLEGYYYKWRKTYRMVDVIIAPSQFLFDKFSVNEQLKDKLVMMHNFLDAIPQSNDSVNEVTGPYALYFGRYAKEKGIETLLECAKRTPNIKYVFAGNGPLEDMVNAVPNVINMGFCNGEKMRRLINDARVSIYPSEWYENCPFSVMESQMYKTPVIGSNIGGIPELVEGGMLFEPGNADALTAAVQALMTDDRILAQCEAGCNAVHFDTAKEYAEKLLKIYGKCDE